MILPWDYLTAWRESRDRGFAWKVRWRMKHDRNPLLVEIQDKYRVKDYARRRGVEPVPVLYLTDRPDSLPFDELPDDCFIKATHGCGWNIARIGGQLYRFAHGEGFLGADGTPVSASRLARFRLTRREGVELCGRWLRRRYRREEWAYRDIPPRIMVEEAVSQKGRGFLWEYKLYVMHGRVRAISVVGPLFRQTGSDRLFFDPDWQPFPMTRLKVRYPDRDPWTAPDSLADMIRVGERLGEGVDFIRADVFDTPRGVLLGEITVYPYAGTPGSPSSCPVFNRWLGDQWVLPA